MQYDLLCPLDDMVCIEAEMVYDTEAGFHEKVVEEKAEGHHDGGKGDQHQD